METWRLEAAIWKGQSRWKRDDEKVCQSNLLGCTEEVSRIFSERQNLELITWQT